LVRGILLLLGSRGLSLVLAGTFTSLGDGLAVQLSLLEGGTTGGAGVSSGLSDNRLGGRLLDGRFLHGSFLGGLSLNGSFDNGLLGLDDFVKILLFRCVLGNQKCGVMSVLGGSGEVLSGFSDTLSGSGNVLLSDLVSLDSGLKSSNSIIQFLLGGFLLGDSVFIVLDSFLLSSGLGSSGSSLGSFGFGSALGGSSFGSGGGLGSSSSGSGLSCLSSSEFLSSSSFGGSLGLGGSFSGISLSFLNGSLSSSLTFL
jgi:hypothetical protein